jgi:hypothetical protein
MIHRRMTVQIAPGRQADMLGRIKEFEQIWQEHGVTMRIQLVTTGSLGRICFSADFDSMAHWEAIIATIDADPRVKALDAKGTAEILRGELFFVPGTWHVEFWRDA